MMSPRAVVACLLAFGSAVAWAPGPSLGFPRMVRGHGGGRTSMLAAVLSEPHRAFLSSRPDCAAGPPQRLEALLTVLCSLGAEVVPPTSPDYHDTVHPLVVPLARNATGYFGLLRWPSTPFKWPLVFTGESGLALLSESVEDFIMRAAAEADFSGSPLAADLVAVANHELPEGRQYVAGSAQAFAKGLPAFLMLRVSKGSFPDVLERLALQHLARDDAYSSLITADRACDVFEAWGGPWAFRARLMSTQPHYELEERDSARSALEKPLWTVSPAMDEFLNVVETAGFKSPADLLPQYRSRLEADRRTEISKGEITPQEVALEKAMTRMDIAVLEHGAAAADGGVSWGPVRRDLATLLASADKPDLARLVLQVGEATEAS